MPQIYDSFSDREYWYLVLQYLEGTTLETSLQMRVAQGKPIQVDETLAMGLQLCLVLEYLHTHQPPVVFRDLKPGNIIRSPAGTLCLIDFGIACHFRPGQASDTQALGSPGYAAPSSMVERGRRRKAISTAWVRSFMPCSRVRNLPSSPLAEHPCAWTTLPVVASWQH